MGCSPRSILQTSRAVFTQGNTSLGRRTLPLVRQSDDPRYAKFRENVRWMLGRELYVALNLPGSKNNWGGEQAPSEEYTERNAANIAWLRESFDVATRERRRAIAIFIQANPGLDMRPQQRKPEDETGYDDFNGELKRLAAAFQKPVLLVHGDSHYFRMDMPNLDAQTGRVVPNITRVEGFADPNYHWVRIVIDEQNRRVFTSIPEITSFGR